MTSESPQKKALPKIKTRVFRDSPEAFFRAGIRAYLKHPHERGSDSESEAARFFCPVP